MESLSISEDEVGSCHTQNMTTRIKEQKLMEATQSRQLKVGLAFP